MRIAGRVSSMSIPQFDSRRLTKDSLLLRVLAFRIRPQHSAKVIIVNPFLIGHHELPPPLLAFLALHIILVYRLRNVNIWKVFLEVLEDFVVDLGKP